MASSLIECLILLINDTQNNIDPSQKREEHKEAAPKSSIFKGPINQNLFKAAPSREGEIEIRTAQPKPRGEDDLEGEMPEHTEGKQRNNFEVMVLEPP